MSPEKPFLEAIRDAPEDDLPRLVFADWLDENGQPDRAEFIRVQCELAKLTFGHPDYYSLWSRSEEIFREHRPNWEVTLPEGIQFGQTFTRGLIDSVLLSRMTSSDAAGISPLGDVFSQGVVTKLMLVGVRADSTLLRLLVGEMKKWPALRSLRELKAIVGRPTRPGEVARLVTNPHLAGLKELDLSLGFTPAELARCGTATFASGIERFRVGVRGNRADWCQAWLRLPFLPRLAEVDFSISHLTDDEFALLLTGDLSSVTKINVGNTEVTDRVFELLSGWTGLERLQVLELAGARLSPDALSRLADLSAENLTALELGGGYGRPASWPDSEYRRLLASQLGDRLEELNLDQIESAGSLQRTLASSAFPRLTRLSLLYTALPVAEFRELVRAPWFRQLTSVHLADNQLTDEHVEALVAAETHPHIDLVLRQTHFGERAVQRLQERFPNQREREFGTSSPTPPA